MAVQITIMPVNGYPLPPPPTRAAPSQIPSHTAVRHVCHLVPTSTWYFSAQLRIVDPLMAERMAMWALWGVINAQRKFDAYAEVSWGCRLMTHQQGSIMEAHTA